MRAGVAGGVLSTLAVAGASGSANAAEPVTQTLELPTLTADLAAQVAQSADATQQTAANYQLQAERDQAAANAAKQAKADLADAKQKAAEAKKKAQEAARKAAAERASRNAERTTLSTTASTSTGTATGSAAAVVAFVKAQIGKAYVSGATGPSAYDCSGLVQTAFKQVGISLPRVSQDQSTAGTQVSLSNLQPGDILYWGSAGSAYHVAVYVGDGMFVGAQNPSSGVGEHPLSYDPPTGAVRVL
ncbi:glycoside hydrolase [Streptomyces diastatochromogenes]|uniref:Glycoside hydrolase n=1 Tax=Streptomyces diastatochromogenes TaxID=42236 RepID=A0A233STA6_STRDA|nr:glycoside hydrolase [Streptomyces diastatochromogenes]